VDTQVFATIRNLVYRESGISLSQEKIQLVANRLQKRLRALGLSSEQQYVEILETDATGEELIQLIDAISTNVTYFYREHKHFEILETILRGYEAERRSKVRIWCAAASSGEEPYTLAMVAREALDTRRCDVKVLATDICTRVLTVASNGVYPAESVAKLPQHYQQDYFSPAGKEQQRINPQIASMVTFKKLNLAKVPLPLNGPIDIIFCRNVMIYFDLAVRTKLVREFERLLAPGGYLFLSHSENLLGIQHKLESRAVAVHQKSLERGV